MGMFDHVKVEYPLPDGVARKEWQTKSLDCLMDTYTIREDGTLWRTSGWLRSDDDERPAERMTWTGEMSIHAWDRDSHEWFEFVVVFHDGVVHRIERTEAEV